MHIEQVEKMCGGFGQVTIKHLLEEEQMKDNAAFTQKSPSIQDVPWDFMSTTEKARLITSSKERASTATTASCAG